MNALAQTAQKMRVDALIRSDIDGNFVRGNELGQKLQLGVASLQVFSEKLPYVQPSRNERELQTLLPSVRRDPGFPFGLHEGLIPLRRTQDEPGRRTAASSAAAAAARACGNPRTWALRNARWRIAPVLGLGVRITARLFHGSDGTRRFGA